MEALHPSNLCLIALVFFYTLNLAPMIFESFTSDRIWASNPPDSFSMFLGQYGNKTTHYWRVVSPLAASTFILSIILNWHNRGRLLLLGVAFASYIAVQIATMVYFVPEQEALVAKARELSAPVLKGRANRWIFRNYFRIISGTLSFVLLLLAVLVPRVP